MININKISINILSLLFLLSANVYCEKGKHDVDIINTCTVGNDIASDTIKISELNSYKPEQIHLSLGLNYSEICITWSTLKRVSRPRVEYKLKESSREQISYPKEVELEVNITEWISGNESSPRVSLARGEDKRRSKDDKKRLHFTYRAKLKNLLQNRDYIYRIVSDYDDDNGGVFINEKKKQRKRIFSNYYEFSSFDFAQTTDNKSFKLALFGDLGLINGQSIPRLIERVDNKEFNLIIHNGDFAYDLDRYSGKQGDEFMRLIEPIAARVAYETSVGNHEIKERFLHYNERFTMLNSGSNPSSASYGKINNFYYSYNVGPIHFIGISTEFYYFYDYIGIEPLFEQFKWLTEDLAYASGREQRVKQPWIIVYGHRPMYCSSTDNDDCTKRGDILRLGIPFINAFGLEELFYSFGVDVLFWSHEHQYERFLPIYNNKIMNGTTLTDDPYFNPNGPVHIISGSAGCEERIDDFVGKPAIGSIVRVSDYGFTELIATNGTLVFKQISDDNEGKIVDKFTITKTNLQNFP